MHLKRNIHHPSGKGLKLILLGVIVNTVLFIIKGLTGILGNSFALIADAIESASDVFISVLSWIGIKYSARAPDEDHPYGHGKAEPLVAIFISVLLMAAAVVIIIHSIRYIITPDEGPKAFTLWVLILVILVKEILFRFVIRTGKEIKSTAMLADAWHHRSDAITSGMALIGISIAVLGGEGYEAADDWAALFASAIILFNAVRIMSPAVMEVMDTAPSPEMIKEVKSVAAKVDGVLDTEKCLIRKMGFEYYVDLHIIVDGRISVKEGHDIAHRVKDRILEENSRIYDVLVHVEPLL